MAQFKVATYNCNSIRSRLPLVISWLAREKPDVLCLQETKTPDTDFPIQAFQEAGYHVAFRGFKGQAGVAVATREEPRDVRFGLDSEPTDEDRLILLWVRGISIVNTYVPQGQSVDHPMFSYKLEWLARLARFLAGHFSPQDPLLWCGDFNVAPQENDVHSPDKLKNHVDFHPKAREALEKIRQWGLVDVFRKHHPNEPGQYTFWDYRVPQALERNVGWRVDHIWATQPLAEKSVRAWIDREARRAPKPSDHTFLVAEFDL